MGLQTEHVAGLLQQRVRIERFRHVQIRADLYMTKPFDPDALLDKARTVLGL